MIGCKKCGECCKYVAIVADTMDINARRWCLYHGHIIREREDKYIIFIPNKCDALNDNNECSIYEDRPSMCKEIPNEHITIFQPPNCRYFEEEEKNG